MHVNMCVYIFMQFFHYDSLATPKDTWPKIEKLGNPFSLSFSSPLYNASLFPGLSMELGEMKGGCQYFYLEHSPAYQKIQYKFWDSVETFDPNAIAVKDHTLDINLP